MRSKPEQKVPATVAPATPKVPPKASAVSSPAVRPLATPVNVQALKGGPLVLPKVPEPK
eukprot:symbB.v1.2.040386.t1/scaffold7188.1/size12817/1